MGIDETEDWLPSSLKHEETCDVLELGLELSGEEGSGDEMGDKGAANDGREGMLKRSRVGVGEIMEVFEIMAKSSSVSSSSESMSCWAKVRG